MKFWRKYFCVSQTGLLTRQYLLKFVFCNTYSLLFTSKLLNLSLWSGFSVPFMKHGTKWVMESGIFSLNCEIFVISGDITGGISCLWSFFDWDNTRTVPCVVLLPSGVSSLKSILSMAKNTGWPGTIPGGTRTPFVDLIFCIMVIASCVPIWSTRL